MEQVTDSVQVVAYVQALRWFAPKIDGWYVVMVAALLSLLQGYAHFEQVLLDGLTSGEVRALVFYSVTVFGGAFGGWSALMKAIKTGQTPQLVQNTNMQLPEEFLADKIEEVVKKQLESTKPPAA